MDDGKKSSSRQLNTLNGIVISDEWRPCQCTIYFLREVPTMDLKDRSPGSMSAVLILGIWKASSFSLSKFILELSLSVSESTAAWFWSFTRLENILQPTETSLTLPAIRKERRARGKKTLNQLFHWNIYYFGVSYLFLMQICSSLVILPQIKKWKKRGPHFGRCF